MAECEATPEWLKRKYPGEWAAAERKISQMPDCTKAGWRWEMLRRWPAFVTDCKAVQKLRAETLQRKLAGYRNQKEKDRLLGDLPGLQLCKADVDALCLNWQLTATHSDGNLLFINPETDFETLATCMGVILLLHKMPFMFPQWAEDFATTGNDLFIGFYEARMVGPTSTMTPVETTFSSYLEVTFKRFSALQCEKLIDAIKRDEEIYCFEVRVGPDGEDKRSIIFKFATRAFPVPDAGADSFKYLPVLKIIQKIVKDCLGVELPSAVVHNQNRPDAIKKQIQSLRGETNESRPKTQARKKMRAVENTAKKRSKIIADIKK